MLESAIPQRLRDYFPLLAPLTPQGVFAAVVIVAVVLSGPMVAGYGVLDELGIYAVLAATIGIWLSARWTESHSLERMHRWLFLIFLAYLGAETIRGMIALGDIRVIRFTVMFAALAVISIFLPGISKDRPTQFEFARLLVISGSLYFFAYFIAGVVAENAFDLGRFDLQGTFWSGTTTAVFPVYVMMTPLALIGTSGQVRDRRLFWIGYSILVLICAYYDSRSMRVALLLFILFGCMRGGLRRVAILFVTYLVFLVYFPWTTEERLTPKNFLGYVASFGKVDSEMIAFRSWNYVEGVLPGVFPLIRDELHSGLKTSVSPLVQRAYRVYDFDRKLAVVATFRHVTSDGLGRMLFGSGYYTHRFNLIQAFKEVAAENNFKLPISYSTIVRSATFNGMLADTGFVGIVLLAGLFVFCGLTILMSRNGFTLLSLSVLGLIVISLVSSAQYDLVLLYLALMPRGPVVAFHGLRRDERGKLSTARVGS